jgi:hypothetical protein
VLRLLLLLFMLLLGLTLYQQMRSHLICTEMVPWNSGESRVMGSLVLTGTGLLTSESPASTCSLKRARFQQLMACSLALPPQFGPDCCCWSQKGAALAAPNQHQCLKNHTIIALLFELAAAVKHGR